MPSPPPVSSPPLPSLISPSSPSYTIRHNIPRIPSPGPTNISLSTAQQQHSRLMQQHQRDRLGSFTVNELQDAGCWDKSGADRVKKSDLEGGIHPLFEKGRWAWRLPDDKRLETVPGEGGKEGGMGQWEVGNERVWGVLEPCLRLASRLVGNVWLWPWLDALFSGPWTYIDEALMPDSPDHSVFSLIGASSFWRRSVLEIVSGKPMQESIDQHLSELAKYMALGFAAHSPKGPLPGNVLAAYHKVMSGQPPEYRYKANMIYLSTWVVEPLLVMELSESERLVQQFAVAKTLLHETMHACGWFAKSRRDDLSFWTPEPFFEDEAMCELGRSWETSVFGGLTQALFFDPLVFGKTPSWTSPLCAMTSTTWPNFSQYGTGKYKPGGALVRYRFPEQFGPGSCREMWPIQLALIENLQQEDFWRVQVAAMGAACIRFPKIFGRRDYKGKNSEMIYGVDYERWVGPKYQYLPEPEVLSTMSGRQRWEAEEARRVRGNAILIAVRRERREKKAAKAKQNERVRLFRVQQVALLDAALRCWDVDVFTDALGIYAELKTPFAAVALQRNLGMFGLLQACYGGDRGKRDRWVAAREMLRLEEVARTTNIESQKSDFRMLVGRVLDIFVKDKTLSPDVRNLSDGERLDAAMKVIRAIATQSVDHIPPIPSDMGGLDKDTHYPLPDVEVERKRKVEEEADAPTMESPSKKSRSGDGTAVARGNDGDPMEGVISNGDAVRVEPVGIFKRIWRAFF